MTVVLLGALVALALSFMGRFHGLGDSLAVFRVPLSAVAAAAALATWAGGGVRRALVGLMLALLAGGTVWLQYGNNTAVSDGIVLYQKNRWVALRDPGPLAQDIVAAQADFVTLQEVAGPTDPLLRALAQDYPVQLYCPFARVGGTAVLSRTPQRAGSFACTTGGMTSAVFETPEGPLRVAAIHLFWPWPMEQRAQLQTLTTEMSTWTEPVAMGGDFNMVRWSWALREIQRSAGVTVIGRSRVTLADKAFGMRLPIDHVLATGGGMTQIRPTLGSDHNGVLARIAIDR